MSKIVLNRKQISQLSEIVNHFKEIDNFTIKVDQSSGIGLGISVTFDLFKKEDTSIDITDLSTW
jgi:hypothetical protein